MMQNKRIRKISTIVHNFTPIFITSPRQLIRKHLKISKKRESIFFHIKNILYKRCISRSNTLIVETYVNNINHKRRQFNNKMIHILNGNIKSIVISTWNKYTKQAIDVIDRIKSKIMETNSDIMLIN